MSPDEAEITAPPVDEQLPWALADRVVQAQVEALVLGAVQHPVQVGRYEIERSLGSGGMGRLLLAFDPDLQRSVALKLIAPAHARSPGARQRIVREARTMAQLSDPHVAQVYEVDDVDGQLVLAIEFVDGRDVREWLDEGPRPLDEVLGVFRQAGAGLAAAHAKGITHRDFKPDNVMLDEDGRAKVVDFGLAHPGSAQGSGDRHALVGHESAVALTQTGAVLGTPAYMAPEQWDDGEADARSDQFAFCVALFEALCGRRPFAGETAAEVRRSLDAPPAAWSASVPRWVRRAVGRGMRREPAKRWPDMASLLSALDPGRRRRRFALLGTAGIVAGLAVLAVQSPTDRCADAGAAMDKHWNAEVRASVMSAAAQADASWGVDSGARLVVQLDEHAEAWRSSARSTCVADPIPSNPTASCVEQGRRTITRFIDEATGADPLRLVSAVARAELIADPRACADSPALAAYAPSAADPSQAHALLDTAERGLGSMQVRGDADGSDYGDAVADARVHAREAIAAAEAAEHEPLLARALFVAGQLALRDGAPEHAERQLRRALTVAAEAAQAPLAAAIVTELVYAVARDRERFGEAEDLTSQATGMIAALGNPPLLRSRLLSHHASATAHAVDADHDAAVALHEEALGLLVDTLGTHHPAAIAARGNLGAALNYARRPADAELELSAAISAADAAWGDNHPRTALLMGTLGLAQMRQGKMGHAEDNLRRSLSIRQAAFGSDHGQVDDARYNLASVLRRTGRHDEALPLLEMGLAHTLARVGPDDARLGPWWVATGESALALGDHRRAREALEASLRVFERTGASARDYARVRLALARSWSQRDPARARVIAQQARADAIEAEASARKTEIDALLATL